MARPYIPGIYRPDSTIADMILQQGNQQAQNTANMWGGISDTVGQLGQAAIGQHTEQKKQQMQMRQEQAFLSLTKDPANPPTLNQVVGIFGHEKGVTIYKGLESLKGPKPDLKTIMAAHKAAPPGVRAAAWPAERALLVKSGVPETSLPGDNEYDDGWFDRFEAAVAGPKKLEKGSPGDVFFDPADPTGGAKFSIPAEAKPDTRSLEARLAAAPPDSPEAQQILDTMGKQAAATRAPVQPGQGRQPNWQEAVGPDGKPILFDEASGQTKAYPEGVSPKATAKERAVTGMEKNVLNFYNRAAKALEDIAPLENKIADAGYVDQARLQYQGPGSNLLQSKEQQQYRQAQRSFTEARLRKDSGGAIKDEEYEYDAKTYFAQPGDEEPVRLQKKAARETILASLAYASGKAYEEYYGTPPPTANNPNGKVGGPGGKIRKKFNPATGLLE